MRDLTFPQAVNSPDFFVFIIGRFTLFLGDLFGGKGKTEATAFYYRCIAAAGKGETS